MLREERGIDDEETKNIVNNTLVFTKRATPATHFHPSFSDAFDRNKGIVVPDDLDTWFDEMEKAA